VQVGWGSTGCAKELVEGLEFLHNGLEASREGGFRLGEKSWVAQYFVPQIPGRETGPGEGWAITPEGLILAGLKVALEAVFRLTRRIVLVGGQGSLKLDHETFGGAGVDPSFLFGLAEPEEEK
jgi:hypothetical protein